MNNAEFIRLMFSNAAPGALPWATQFTSAPADASRGAWSGWPVRRPYSVPSGAGNTYCVISTFVAVAGRYARRKANFSAMHAVMVDDVGVKVPETAIALPFTVEVETSPGNRQGWYRLDPPVTDRALAERLIERMVAAGLTADGRDPGMKGVTRYGRLPVGYNNKPAVVAKLGGPWLHLVTECRPRLAYTVAELAEAYGLDLTPPAPRVTTPRTAASAEATSALDWIKLFGLYQQPTGEGWHAITCPWVHQHTARADSGTGYSEPSPNNNYAGGFKCHHGHCEGRHIGHLLTFIQVHAERLRKANREPA